MRDSDWSRQNLLRSDWLGPSVALITTFIRSHFVLCGLLLNLFIISESQKKKH